jgi:uncharacterized protein (DUF433 family)
MTQGRITIDPDRMRGLACIGDTRVTASAVLGQLAAGSSLAELLADYPYLEREDVLAAIEYVANSRLTDLGLRAHGLAESPEGELIDDEGAVRRLLDP